jgi:hypothetical protein
MIPLIDDHVLLTDKLCNVAVMIFAKVMGVCPECDGQEIERCRRKGLLELFICPLINYWPYRCRDCDMRFFARPRLPLAGNFSR